MRAFPIDFIRQAIEQTLLEEHIINPKYVGGKDQVALTSFYEQLQNQQQVDRFLEVYRDLTDQQNRLGLIANGVLVSSENPTITNVRQGLVIPMNWTCSFRCTLANRDSMVDTINNLIERLKGRKIDIAEINETGELFKVETIGQRNGLYSGKPTSSIWCYLVNPVSGDLEDNVVDTWVRNTLTYFPLRSYPTNTPVVFYASDINSHLATIVLDETTNQYKVVENDNTEPNVIFAPKGQFTKYKMSMSFDAIRCETPITLNSEEYIEISFGGSATLVSEKIKLGNDLVRVSAQKKKIIANPDITFNNATIYELDPLELPHESAINSTINHIASNGFIPNTHADTLTPSIQYTFLIDEEVDLLKQLFEYSRYGNVNATANGISPNMIFEINEYWCAWGISNKYTFPAKIVSSIPVENTESDVMTIATTFEIQGENN